ncbi:DUF1145 domain-containing protein [Pseudomonas sp. NCCP-436]|uniref:DUF1145 domain-containing protein n=1 Tax=Pseudomonas sp. NCCP-436 TaxID=2842481 RepID=UPI001C7FD74D|nr:DUF1145 domain-containing protein [Pseudomonas sp. NCCP-436]
MKAMMWGGKLLALCFWLVFGATLGGWLGAPFEQLIQLLAVFLLLLHCVQLWLFSSLLRGRSNPWLDRFLVLLFGIFHLYMLRSSAVVQSVPADATGGAANA